MKMRTWTALAVLLTALAGAAGYEEVPRPTIGEDFDEDHTAEQAWIDKVNTLEREDWPEGGLVLPVAFDVDFYSVRATDDWDTRVYDNECPPREVPLHDSLRPDWPRWKKNFGEWVYGDKGPIVTYHAPESGIGVSISLWEDDYPPNPDRDDHQLAEYGVCQDLIGLTVVDFVELTIHNGGGTVTNGPGADSQSALKLWVDGTSIEKHDWRDACENDETGDHINGGASYEFVDTEHPNDPVNHGLATGTGLKTEIYATIDKSAFQDMPFVLQRIEDDRNWHIVQQKSGVDEYGYYASGTWHDIWNVEDENCRPPSWASDIPGGYADKDNDCVHFDLDPERTTDYLYAGDAPCIHDTEDGMEWGRLLEALGYITGIETATHRRANSNYRTWVAFQSRNGNVYHQVTPTPPPGNYDGQYWADGTPMWGYTGSCHRDSTEDDWWHVEEEAVRKTYGE